MGSDELRYSSEGPDGAADAEGTVLVVDDDPFLSRLLEIELAAAGFRVHVANDGLRALDLAFEVRPDLVLVDVMMPAMDGLELTRRLRTDPRTSSVRVIILSARGQSADRELGLGVGADDYVVKPFETPVLIDRIRDLLRSSATS